MTDLGDGESIEMQGSGAKPYVLKNVGGVYSCTCPAWRNQSVAIERRTCKHLRKLRGEAAERERLGAELPPKPATADEEQAGPPLLLAQTWDNAADLTGWWMSEKLDGVRRVLGRPTVPVAPGEHLPCPGLVRARAARRAAGRRAVDRPQAVSADGKHRAAAGQKRSLEGGPLSGLRRPEVRRGLRVPAGVLGGLPAGRTARSCLLHAHERCRGLPQLREELARVESLGGEGLMLRQPGSVYEHGRSFTLLKIKTFRDAEAVVLAHQPGKGKHKGRLGALAVRLPDGTEFSVGTGFSDAERAAPPPVGSTVTFRYQELSDGGVPRFPSFVRVCQAAPVETAVPAAPAKAASSPTRVTEDKAEMSVPTTPRHFEFVAGKSSKFWEISVADCDVTVRYGRIGSAGTTKVKTFPDSAAASKHAAKLIAEKTGEGYVETGT